MAEEADGSVEVEIRAKLETLEQGLRQARQRLDVFAGQTKGAQDALGGLNKASVGLSSALHGVAAQLPVVGGLMSGAARQFSSLAIGAGSLAIGVGAVAAAFVAVVPTALRAVRAFSQLEREQATYNAVLRATGFAAGRTGDDIENLASEIRRTAGALEGDVRSAAAVLATFGGVAGEQFDRALRVSKDMSAVLGGNMASAARTLGRALENPAEGMQMLRRAGVMLSETQKQQIRNFAETGNRAAATNVILSEVERRYGGAGEAIGGGLIGATSKLGEATNNLLEQWGEQIVKGLRLTSIINSLTSAVDAVVERGSRSPQDQLAAVEAEIRRRRSAPGTMLPGVDAANVRAINRLLAQRESLLVAVRNRQQEVDASMDTAEVGRMVAEETRRISALQGVANELQKEREQLGMTAVQREIDARIKKAAAEAGQELSESEKRNIANDARRNFYLREGSQLLQARAGLLAELAPIELRVAAANAAIADAIKAGNHFTKEQIALMEQRNEMRVNEAVINERASLGLGSALELQTQRQRELDLITKTYNLSAQEQITVATALDRKYRELADSIAVAGSKYPEFTRAALEATNANKQIDQLLTGSLNNTATALTDIATGAKTAEEAFKNLAQSVIRDLIQMTIRAQLFRLVSGFMGGGAGSGLFGSANGNVFSGGNVIPFARGGVVTRPTLFPMANGTGLMGEAGPEAVMPLKRGPGGRLGVEVNNGNRDAQALAMTVHVVVNDEKFSAYVEDGAGRVVARSTPQIVGAAVAQSNAQAPGSVSRYQHDRGGEYRV